MAAAKRARPSGAKNAPKAQPPPREWQSIVPDVVHSLLPAGSRPDRRDVAAVPLWPPDVYAVAATLLERSGGYHFIRPMRFDPMGDAPSKQDDPFQIFGRHQLLLRIRGMAWAHSLPFLDRSNPRYDEYAGRAKQSFRVRYHFYEQSALKFADEEIEKVGRKCIQDPWTALVNSKERVLHADYDFERHAGDVHDLLNTPHHQLAPQFPHFWQHALHLLIMADEASVGLGFPARLRCPDENKNVGATFWQEYLASGERSRKIDGSNTGALNPPRPWRQLSTGGPMIIQSLGMMVNPDVACVLPKARTPKVGCTLRSLSHHLALAPPAGRAKVRWHLLPPSDQRWDCVFNMLIVPFPYKIDSRCFAPVFGDSVDLFETEQRWLPDDPRELALFIKALVKASEAEIHGVVLPEYALDWRAFEAVKSALLEFDSIELFVTGLSHDVRTERGGGDQTTKGNFVATCVRVPSATRHQPRTEWDLIAVRGKHHRWRLDERQLSRYGLAHRLPPDRGWWENIELEPRTVDVVQFRGGSAMTALICEDLARIEPCQAVLRATGPNLVVVLLMDGPQVEARWPNQYAGILADDPGCSVITLTSLGLPRRIRSDDGEDRLSIGLWRDGFGETKRLNITGDEAALVVTLVPKSLSESTLDGRPDGGSAFGWTLRGVNPVSLDAARWRAIRC